MSKLPMFRSTLLIAMAAAASGCSDAPQAVGSTLLNVQPPPPRFATGYDFELLERVKGTACIKPATGHAPRQNLVYWLGSPALDRVAAVARPAVTAAAIDALDKLSDADSLVITRIVTEARGSDETCAYVYGRAVRLTKSEGRSSPRERAPDAEGSDPDDDEGSSSDEDLFEKPD